VIRESGLTIIELELELAVLTEHRRLASADPTVPTAPPMRLLIPNPNPKTHPNPNPLKKTKTTPEYRST